METATPSKYRTEEDILELVRKFERCTISRDDWKHAEHLIVALHYISTNEFSTAFEKMRCGIMTLLKDGFKLDLTKEMPYHETLTRFWMDAVFGFWTERRGVPITEVAAEILVELDKNYPLRSYTRELLFSDEARKNFVEPDIIDHEAIKTDLDAQTL